MSTIHDRRIKALNLEAQAFKFQNHLFELYMASDFDQRLERIQSRLFKRWERRQNQVERLFDACRRPD